MISRIYDTVSVLSAATNYWLIVRLRLLVDVSGSMYRFNGHDARLQREMEAVCMVMEAFQGYENKLKVISQMLRPNRNECVRSISY